MEPVCEKHGLTDWPAPCPECQKEWDRASAKRAGEVFEAAMVRQMVGGYESDQEKPGFIGGYKICNRHGPYSEPGCQKCQSELNEDMSLIAESIAQREDTMKTPTEAQLRDPKWWDENAPEWARSLIKARTSVEDLAWFEHVIGVGKAEWLHAGDRLTADTRQPTGWTVIAQRPTKPEPQPEQDSIADRIMELCNQVHNLACEVQNDEALAGELEDIRGRLRDLGGKVHKAREREEAISAAKSVIKVALIVNQLDDDTERGLEALYDAGMLRKAGGE